MRDLCTKRRDIEAIAERARRHPKTACSFESVRYINGIPYNAHSSEVYDADPLDKEAAMHVRIRHQMC